MFTYFVRDYAIAAGAFMESVIRRPVILYGHSLGAMVAALVGSRIPRLTIAMILEDPPFHTMGNRLEGSYHHRYFASLQDLVRRRSEESLMFKQLSAMTVTEPEFGRRSSPENNPGSGIHPFHRRLLDGAGSSRA